MPEQKLSYFGCQHFYPKEAHNGGRCTCHDKLSLKYCKEHSIHVLFRYAKRRPEALDSREAILKPAAGRPDLRGVRPGRAGVAGVDVGREPAVSAAAGIAEPGKNAAGC